MNNFSYNDACPDRFEIIISCKLFKSFIINSLLIISVNKLFCLLKCHFNVLMRDIKRGENLTIKISLQDFFFLKDFFKKI